MPLRGSYYLSSLCMCFSLRLHYPFDMFNASSLSTQNGWISSPVLVSTYISSFSRTDSQFIPSAWNSSWFRKAFSLISTESLHSVRFIRSEYFLCEAICFSVTILLKRTRRFRPFTLGRRDRCSSLSLRDRLIETASLSKLMLMLAGRWIADIDDTPFSLLSTEIVALGNAFDFWIPREWSSRNRIASSWETFHWNVPAIAFFGALLFFFVVVILVEIPVVTVALVHVFLDYLWYELR